MSMKQILHQDSVKKILNVLNDGLYFSDGTGNTIWLNDASEKILGTSRHELISRNVYDLEQEGVMTPSITRMVLEAGGSINTVQTSLGSRQYLVSGHKMDIEGEPLIIVHSRDITKNVKTSMQLEETESLLRRYSQEIRNIQVAKKEQDRPDFLGKGPSFVKLLDLIGKVAGVQTTVLITGETGVGKNAAAERIHDLSERHSGSFMQVNCGTIPESLIESELFGYTKGAFTGAYSGGKTGLVKLADKGTLFLDEIGELPLHVQPKLLELLQDKTFLPVGETSRQRVDIRIIAATNKNLKKMVEEGKFREDLFYRLHVLPIHVPALRERREDIVPILQASLERFNEEHHTNRHFSNKVLDILQKYEWPGNIRELENVVERMVITSGGETITVEDLPEDVVQNRSSSTFITETKSLPETLAAVEKEMVDNAYEKYGSTRKAAEALGITQSSFMRRWKKYRDHSPEDEQ